MAVSRPNVHNVIIQSMQDQGYEANKGGVCRGISFMWHQYFQSGREAEFYAQIELLREPGFLDKFSQVTDKVKAHLPLTDAEQKIIDVKSFLDGIELYFHILARREFVGELLGTSDKELISRFTASKALEKQGGLEKVFTQTRLLTKIELQNYFKHLSEFHLNLKNSLADSKEDNMPLLSYSFRNDLHEVNFKYDYQQDRWILIDSNQLPPDPKGFSSEEFASQLMKACGDENSAMMVFNVEMLSTKNTHDNFPAIDNSLQQFLALEQITSDEMSRLNSRNRTLLCQAAANNDTSSFQRALKLLDESTSYVLNQSDSSEQTPLLYLMRNSLADLQEFHVAGGDINLGNGAAGSPIYMAIKLGNVEIINYLLEHEVSTQEDLLGEAILETIILGHLEVLQYFKKEYAIDYSTFKTIEGHNALQLAAMNGRVDIANFLIEDCKMDVTVKTSSQETLYHLAVRSGRVDFVRFLKRYSACDVNAKNSEGYNALQVAVMNGRVDIANFLIEDCKMDVTVKTGRQETLYHLAARSGSVDFVRFLKRYPACDLNAKNSVGVTALNYSIAFGNMVVLHELISGRKLYPEVNDAFFNVITRAIMNGHIDVLRYIQAYLFTIDLARIKNSEGLTLLHQAAQFGQLPIMKFLIEECKADMTVVNKDGASLLMIALNQHNLHIVPYILQIDPASFDRPTLLGMMPLHMAAQMGQLDMVEWLLQTNPQRAIVTDNNGGNVLHYAIHFQQKDVVQFLITHYPETIALTGSGRAPAQLAAATNNPEIIQLFSSPALSSVSGLFKAAPGVTAPNISSAPGVSKKI